MKVRGIVLVPVHPNLTSLVSLPCKHVYLNYNWNSNYVSFLFTGNEEAENDDEEAVDDDEGVADDDEGAADGDEEAADGDEEAADDDEEAADKDEDVAWDDEYAA